MDSASLVYGRRIRRLNGLTTCQPHLPPIGSTDEGEEEAAGEEVGGEVGGEGEGEVVDGKHSHTIRVARKGSSRLHQKCHWLMTRLDTLGSGVWCIKSVFNPCAN